MKPIYQNKFGLGKGNCLQACVASVLELDLNDVPDFNESETKWFNYLVEWAKSKNIGVIYLPVDLNPSPILAIKNCILTYKIKNHVEEHAVIGEVDLIYSENIWKWNIFISHDPNPRKHKLENLTGIVILTKLY